MFCHYLRRLIDTLMFVKYRMRFTFGLLVLFLQHSMELKFSSYLFAMLKNKGLDVCLFFC